MLHRALILAGLLVLALGADPVCAATLHVPKDFKTIQAAIDAAKPGESAREHSATRARRRSAAAASRPPERARLKPRANVRAPWPRRTPRPARPRRICARSRAR